MHVCVCVYKMTMKKVQRITVLRIFAFYSNYGPSANIYQEYIIPDFS